KLTFLEIYLKGMRPVSRRFLNQCVAAGAAERRNYRLCGIGHRRKGTCIRKQCAFMLQRQSARTLRKFLRAYAASARTSKNERLQRKRQSACRPKRWRLCAIRLSSASCSRSVSAATNLVRRNWRKSGSNLAAPAAAPDGAEHWPCALAG